MKPTPYFSAIWIDGQFERIAQSSGKDGEKGDMFPADANRSGSNDNLPLEWQADDVFKHFYEQVFCRVGPTRAIEQAQRELRQRIGQSGEIREGVSTVMLYG